jgi:NAD(P)-dependent dehydrogenase (short-subunit alcohol dehydrogenase family)
MSTNPFSLAGQTVLVVGASSGIGAATAELANRLGGRVILASRSADALAKARADLDRPDRADVVAFDYLDAAAVHAALAAFNRIDHVVITAVADENKKRGAFLELDDATMRASFDKFWGQVNVLRAVVPKMPAGGSATLFASIAGLKPTGKDAGLSLMNGVQAAVIQFGRSLAVELAPIRVNVIAPGVVLTNVWSDAQRAELTGWMEKTLPAQRAGRAEDLGMAAVSLIANPYVTGAVLTVDGGLHLV